MQKKNTERGWSQSFRNTDFFLSTQQSSECAFARLWAPLHSATLSMFDLRALKEAMKCVLSTFLRFFPTATALLMHCAAVSRESANSDIQTLDLIIYFFVGHEDVRVEVDRHRTKGNNERVGTCTLARPGFLPTCQMKSSALFHFVVLFALQWSGSLYAEEVPGITHAVAS